MNRGNWNGAAYSPLAEQLSPASTEALRAIGHVSTAYDVCAGTGNFTLPAAQSGIAVHALDLSASQLEVARERWIPRPGTTEPTFTIGDAQSLPWSDSSAAACVSIFGIILSQPCDRPRRDDAGDPPGWKHLCRNVVGERVGSSTPKGGRLCVEWHHTTTDDMVEPERIREGSSWIGVGELGLAPARVATTSRFGSRRGTVRPGAGVEELSRGGSRRRELGFDVSAPPLDARTLSQVERGRPRRHQRIRPPHGHCPEL